MFNYASYGSNHNLDLYTICVGFGICTIYGFVRIYSYIRSLIYILSHIELRLN